MAHAYTPGLRVAERTEVVKKRILPLPGDNLVKVGDRVGARSVVARAMLPGNVHTMNIVNLLGIVPAEIHDFMLKKAGDPVAKNEPIAENKPLIKWFKTTINSPIEGTIENISEVTGQVLLREKPVPIDLFAYLDGVAKELIPSGGAIVETKGTLIQGIFGVGGEEYAPIAMAAASPDQELTAAMIASDKKGKIVVGGSFIGMDGLRRAKEAGVAGVIVGGIHANDLKQLLGYDLGVAITGTEKIGFTLIVTEGFGRIDMARRTFDILRARDGRMASISGATQIRAGVIRPEIIIPDIENAQGSDAGDSEWKREAMKPGDVIRVIREPYFGRLGKVKALPNEPVIIDTESKVRILEVEFPDGKVAVVPRANVEILEG